MAAPRPQPPYSGPWTERARDLDEWLSHNKVVASATAASLLSTFAGFPLDSLKSRLQSSRGSASLVRLAGDVVREEGIGGLWRGFPLPLITISIVRTISFTIYTSTKRILNSTPDNLSLPAASSSRSSQGSANDAPPSRKRRRRTWEPQLGLFNRDTAGDVAITSLLAGGASGAVVCLGSAPFELVKVRRQLEYQIYRDSHPELYAPQIQQPNTSAHPPPNMSLPQHPAGTSASIPEHTYPTSTSSSSGTTSSPSSSASTARISTRPQPPPFQPPSTLQAVRAIVKAAGPSGLYTGFRLHFVRDTLGTALYFAEYDVLRFVLGRKTGLGPGQNGRGEGEQGDVPDWAKSWLPKGLVPFLCGSVAGVTSWALIYPVDAIKTKAQQRALSGLEPRTPLVQLHRLVRGTDRDNPKPILTGIARLYRGLGVSMIRSMLTHGLLWTIVDAAGRWIDTKPFERYATEYT